VGRKIKNARPRQRGRNVHVNKYIAQRGRTKSSKAVLTASNMELSTSGLSISNLSKAKQRAIEQMESQAAGPITACPASLCQALRSDRKHIDIFPRQYEIWFAELGYHYGTSIQGGCRPVLVVSNDVANRFSQTLTAIPLTTKMKKLGLPTHVLVSEEDCEMLRHEYLLDSLLLVEQVATIDRTMLRNRLCRLKSQEKIAAVKAALNIQLGEAGPDADGAIETIITQEDQSNFIETEVNTSGS